MKIPVDWISSGHWGKSPPGSFARIFLCGGGIGFQSRLVRTRVVAGTSGAESSTVGRSDVTVGEWVILTGPSNGKWFTRQSMR